MSKSYYDNLFDDRKEFCDSLIDFISTITPPEIDLTKEEYPEEIDDTRVISIDAAWGYGKTTFMKALNEKLKEHNFTVFTFNAWANDYEKSALDAFITNLLPQITHLKKVDLEKIKKPISLIKASINEITRITSHSTISFSNGENTITYTPPEIDINDSLKRIKSNADDYYNKNPLNKYNQNSNIKNIINIFKGNLNRIYNKVEKNSSKKIIILIDELDRCKPTFAIELLEIIKHFFDTGKYLFIFTINSRQLMESVKQIYGNCFDETGYFRRFFDYEFYLPLPDLPKYLEKKEKQLNKKYKNNKEFISSAIFCLKNNKELSIRDINKALSFIEIIITNYILLNTTDPIEKKHEETYLLLGMTIKFYSKELFEDLYLKKFYDSRNHYKFTQLINTFNFDKGTNPTYYPPMIPVGNWFQQFFITKPRIELAQEKGQIEQFSCSINDVSGYHKLSYYNIDKNTFYFSNLNFPKEKLDQILLFGNNQIN